jgi:hypothetical protein
MVSKKSIKKLPDQLLARADVISGAITFLGTVGGFEGLASQIQQVMSAPRITNISNVLTYSVPEAIAGGIFPLVGGIILDALDVSGSKKWANALIKTGVGIMGGRIAAGILVNSHNPGGMEFGSASSGSNVWTQKAPAGPVTTSARNLQVTASSPVALPSA